MLGLQSVGRPHTFFPRRLQWPGTRSSSLSTLQVGTGLPVTGAESSSSSTGGGKRHSITPCLEHTSCDTVPSQYPQPYHTVFIFILEPVFTCAQMWGCELGNGNSWLEGLLAWQGPSPRHRGVQTWEESETPPHIPGFCPLILQSLTAVWQSGVQPPQAPARAKLQGSAAPR